MKLMIQEKVWTCHQHEPDRTKLGNLTFHVGKEQVACIEVGYDAYYDIQEGMSFYGLEWEGEIPDFVGVISDAIINRSDE